MILFIQPTGSCYSVYHFLVHFVWNIFPCCLVVMGLETTDVSTSSVSLTWAIPVDAENVYGYFVLLEGDTASINNTIVGVANETTVEGLEPFSSYQACVVPLLVEGNGTENCINVITAEQGNIIISKHRIIIVINIITVNFIAYV